MIKNLLFDMGGVLFEQDTQEAFRRFRAAGIDTDKYMGAFGQRGFFLDLESGSIDAEEFCRCMSVATGRRVDMDEALHCWMGYIRSVPQDRLSRLLELRSQYTLGLLSNTNPFVMSFANSPRFSLEGRPISSFFDHQFFSYELGVCKPSVEIYLNALQIAGMKAEETVFIDDSPKNIEAACSIGIHGLHVATNDDWYGPLTGFLASLT